MMLYPLFMVMDGSSTITCIHEKHVIQTYIILLIRNCFYIFHIFEYSYLTFISIIWDVVNIEIKVTFWQFKMFMIATFIPTDSLKYVYFTHCLVYHVKLNLKDTCSLKIGEEFASLIITSKLVIFQKPNIDTLHGFPPKKPYLVIILNKI